MSSPKIGNSHGLNAPNWMCKVAGSAKMPAPTIPLKERKAEPVKPISRRRRLSGGTSSRSFMATLHPCRNLAGLPRGGKLLALGRVSQDRSEEHTSELQSLMRISYAVF